MSHAVIFVAAEQKRAHPPYFPEPAPHTTPFLLLPCLARAIINLGRVDASPGTERMMKRDLAVTKLNGFPVEPGYRGL